jgi:hypothetical protein
MKEKKTVGKLTILSVLMGLSYLPLANATVFNPGSLGTLGVPATLQLADSNIAQGSFSDTYTFSVDQSATAGSSASGSGKSSGDVSNGDIVSLSGTITLVDGLGLTSIDLYSGGVDLTQGLSSITVTQLTSNDPLQDHYSFVGGFSGIPLTPGATYSLVIDGYSAGLTSNYYTGTLGLATASGTNPVPEPEEWAMMLLGLPLMAWAVRRKQGDHARLVSLMPNFS